MNSLFFLLSLVFLALAYNLFRPIYTHKVGAILSFVLGWLTGELAFHHIAWQLALTLIFVMVGAVQGFTGALGLLACITAWSAMAYYYLSSSSAKTEVINAMRSALGEDVAESLSQQISSRHFQRRQFLTPFDVADAEVERIKDVPYGEFHQCLDIYRGSSASASHGGAARPVLLQIHGGGWTEKMGDKNRQARPLMNHMAKNGWICVSIDYRLSPSATFPAHIIDCKQALVWVKQHIAEYGGNPDFIVTTGGSAGGHLCSLLSLTANKAEFQPGFESEDTEVQGCIPFYGVYDWTNSVGLQANQGLLEMLQDSVMKLSLPEHREQFEQASPLFQIHPQAPPFFIIQGDKDTLVSAREARHFAERLTSASNAEVVYAQISGAQHAFDMFTSLRSEYVKQAVAFYLQRLHSQYLKKNNTGASRSSEVA